jgi:hypothetical protein
VKDLRLFLASWNPPYFRIAQDTAETRTSVHCRSSSNAISIESVVEVNGKRVGWYVRRLFFNSADIGAAYHLH